MEQFSLEKYLENPSRKVVTRDGREVEILKTDFRGYKQIIGVVKNRDNKDDEVEQWDGQGNFRSLFGESKYDLFFADEKEELTEFEKAIYQYICTIVTACDGEVYGDKELKPIVKEIAKALLDLARKELLKDLPKWKTYKGELIGNGLIFEDNGNLVLVRNGYYIDINELDKLPKEE